MSYADRKRRYKTVTIHLVADFVSGVDIFTAIKTNNIRTNKSKIASCIDNST